MPLLTFKDEEALSAFHGMAEGMEEVARDDDQTARAAQLTRLIEHTGAYVGRYPHSVYLDGYLEEIALTVLENLGESEDFKLGDVIITDKPRAAEMGAQEALEEALAVLVAIAVETDTASPEGHRARLAGETINAMLRQRGCEHFDKAVNDGKLTTLIDVIVFG